jgi:hypothetical protein
LFSNSNREISQWNAISVYAATIHGFIFGLATDESYQIFENVHLMQSLPALVQYQLALTGYGRDSIYATAKELLALKDVWAQHAELLSYLPEKFQVRVNQISGYFDQIQQILSGLGVD